MLIKQPTSTTCGQCSLAMAHSLTLERAIKLIGHDGITTPDEMLRALFLITGRAHPMKSGQPPLEGSYLQYHEEPGGTRAHWTFLRDGVLYDPAQKKRLWLVTQYIPIGERA